jgi:hypothetical protein
MEDVCTTDFPVRSGYNRRAGKSVVRCRSPTLGSCLIASFRRDRYLFSPLIPFAMRTEVSHVHVDKHDGFFETRRSVL